jgi:AraC-like DNA-binding protein
MMKGNQSSKENFEAIHGDNFARLSGQHLSTTHQSHSHRLAWLKEVIGREYANVEVMPYKDESIFNDMAIYPWQYGMRLSPISSSALQIERLAHEPSRVEQDCYFAVLLTAGKYKLEQQGREVVLEKGDMTLYDATEWHRITMPEAASKIIVTIPRPLLNQRINNLENLTAKKISAKSGIGAVTSSYIQTTVNQLHNIDKTSFLEMTDPVLDILTLSLNQLKPSAIHLSGTKSSTLFHVKKYIQQHCGNSELTPEIISQAVGLSIRYMNNLFNSEQTSLMRYVTEQRLCLVHRHLSSQKFRHRSITELAMQSGFNNMAHFSRVFKAKYGMSPRQYRESIDAIAIKASIK